MRTPFAILVVSLLSGPALANPKYFTEGTAARERVQKLPSMKGLYVDPCDDPAKPRVYWKVPAVQGGQDAMLALDAYRDVLSCKAIKVYDVPLAHIENDFHQALDAGDAKSAKDIALELRTSAESVAIDEAFVEARMKIIDGYSLDAKVPKSIRAQLTAMLADARDELQAKRYLVANFVLNQAEMIAINKGGIRLPQHRRCKMDPSKPCLK